MSAEAATLPRYSILPPGLKPLLLLVGVAAAVAAGVMVVLWSRVPNYSLLYTDLASNDQAAVAQALDSSGIPYRLEANSNAISVPSDRLNDARLKLAGAGLPEGSGGFAVMGKDPGFGVSQFMENARYQHALETELARTIASLRPVDGARVHLAVPRESAFVRDQRPASASVFVQLKAGRRLEQEQVQSIVNLVASSIPELDASHVTVVDQQGRLLSAPQGNSEEAQRQQQFEMTQRLEDDYSQRIVSILTPFVGPGRVRAQVVAQLDNSVTEEAREQYRPNSQIVRTEQTSEQTSKDGAASGGVPGSLTNQPPTPGTALPPAAATPAPAPAPAPVGAAGQAAAAQAAAAAATSAAASTPDNTAREASRTYEIDRTLGYTRTPSGRLQRLTVAVLIDNVRTTDKDGKVTETPLNEQQVTRITQLVKDAVGFNAERGDSVNVVNSSFRQEEAPPEDELQQPSLWERPMVQDIAKLVAGLIVLLVLIFMVVRPLVRGLLAQSREAPRVAHEAATRMQMANAPNNQPLAYEQQLAQARTMVSQDPKRVAQVVKTWVATDE
jgi:flagellar M-ring protein FliF